MPGMPWGCCFAECLAMCAWCACLNTVLRCSADACLLVPIFADHVGGLHVAMRFEWCVQAFPSGHVGPLATAGNKRWELREGTAKGGGGWHGRSSSQEVEVCLVLVMCYTCVGAPLQASRVSLSHAYGLRASSEHARQTPTYQFFTTSISRRNTHWENSLMMILHTHTTFALTLSRPRQRLFS